MHLFHVLVWGAEAATAPLPREEPVRVAYDAPAVCPDERVFVDRIRRRTRHVQPILEKDAKRSIAVRIATDARGAKGTIQVTSPQGDTSEERTVRSASCDEVVTALSLAAALTFDAEPASASREEVPGTPVGGEPPGPSSPAALSSPAVAKESAEPAPRGQPERWRFAFGAHGGAHGGVAPKVAVAFPVFVEVRAPWSGHAAVRAAFARSLDATADNAEAGGHFTWTAGLLDACPYAIERGPVALSPCVRFEAGAVEGEGTRVAQPRSEARTWLALGAVGRLRIEPVRHWFVELEGGARAPLMQDRFHAYGATLFRPPAVAWSTSAGIGVVLP